LKIQLNALTLEAVSKDTEGAVERSAQVRLRGALACSSCQRQHSAEDSAARLKGLLDLLKILTKDLRGKLIRLHVRQNLLHQRQNGSERVIDIVRHTTNKIRSRVFLLGFQHFCFECHGSLIIVDRHCSQRHEALKRISLVGC